MTTASPEGEGRAEDEERQRDRGETGRNERQHERDEIAINKITSGKFARAPKRSQGYIA